MLESNTFSTIPTERDNFTWLLGEEILENFRETNTEIGRFLEVAEKHDVEVIPIAYAQAKAMAGGPATLDLFDEFRQALLGGLADAGQLDGIFLILHGAMVVEGIRDAEGALLKEIRAQVGPNLPIVTTLDLHANVADDMILSATACVGYKTAPHIDYYEIGQQAAQIPVATIRGEINPVMSAKRVSLMVSGDKAASTVPPLSGLIGDARKLEGEEGVLAVSIIPGFPWADIEYPVTSVVVVTNGDHNLAEELSVKLAKRIWEARHEFALPLVSLDEALAKIKAAQKEDGPIVLSHIADNPTGGGAGDRTELLAALLKNGVKDAVVATIADPAAVASAIDAGIGKDVTLAVGGKVSGDADPLNVTGRVRLISDGIYLTRFGTKADLGRTVKLQVGQVEVILTERRASTSDPELFRSVGIEPSNQSVVVVKDGLHFRDAYEPFASCILWVDTPGWVHPELSKYSFKNVRRPVFPLDPDSELERAWVSGEWQGSLTEPSSHS